MFQKLKKFFSSDKTEPLSKTNNLTYYPSDNFDIFLHKLNTYFDENPVEKQQYKSELNYINSLAHITKEEKKLYSVMPYSFINKYSNQKTEVFKDKEAGMFYVYLDGKKLYYHEGYTTIEEVQQSFTYISAEQDVESPHRYLDDTFFVKEGDTVVDLGAAEGNFSLFVVDRVKELFIVEADSQWMTALHKTFEPWKEKVHIINKFAGDKNDGATITLTAINDKTKIDVVKMDIEGEELSVLREAKELLRQQKFRFAITTYHNHSDANDIKNLLLECNYNNRFSDKFILFIYDTLAPPYFRKGLIKAYK